MQLTRTFRTLASAVALTALALVSACSENDDSRTAGQRVDDAVASAAREADKAGDKLREAGREAKQAASQTTDAVSDKTRDIAITASINGKLAGDERLSALSINVDTVKGQVALRGTAPDTEARNKATVLAQSVDGVMGVTNELTVQPRSK